MIVTTKWQLITYKLPPTADGQLFSSTPNSKVVHPYFYNLIVEKLVLPDTPQEPSLVGSASVERN